MPLTPSDVANKQFGRQVRGYAMDEVDGFLDEVEQELTRLLSENARLAQRQAELRVGFESFLGAQRESRIVRLDADANVGSILGIGFPAWTGGVVQYMNGYEGRTGTGLRGFVTRARELAERYGKHFLPPASLVQKAEKGECIK